MNNGRLKHILKAIISGKTEEYNTASFYFKLQDIMQEATNNISMQCMGVNLIIYIAPTSAATPKTTQSRPKKTLTRISELYLSKDAPKQT